MIESLTHSGLLKLRRFSTPTLSNALEMYKEDSGGTIRSRDETRDFMPELGPMIGYAVTADYCASRKALKMRDRTDDLLRLVEKAPKPCIVVIRDVDSPRRIVGAPWGECFANICYALGAAGTITDGAIRDYSEMRGIGFHALARRLCVSHACGRMVKVGRLVKVFGTTVRTGDLLHADQHGFLIIPPACAKTLAEMAARLDFLEREHIIAPARSGAYSVERFREGRRRFVDAAAKISSPKRRAGEWG
jgi:regulator of RNase E activity RraA